MMKQNQNKTKQNQNKKCFKKFTLITGEILHFSNSKNRLFHLAKLLTFKPFKSANVELM
jgi:hypothetical protein